MGVDVKDLPRGNGRSRSGRSARLSLAMPMPGRGSQPSITTSSQERLLASGAVLRFDSQKKARRYDELAALEQAGKIRDLRLQVDFTLQEAYTDTEGRRVRAIRYRADFTYRTPPAKRWEVYADDPVGWSDKLGIPWELVVEDVKSRATRTKEYIMKRKMMKERFNIDIQEV